MNKSVNNNSDITKRLKQWERLGVKRSVVLADSDDNKINGEVFIQNQVSLITELKTLYQKILTDRAIAFKK